MEHLFDTIFEDDSLLVVNKPADLVCHPTKGDEFSSLISRARIYLDRQGRTDPPYLIHRLDRETSGLVIIAKNVTVARELGKVWETREVRKEYLAIVHGHVAAEQGTIAAPLGRDEGSTVAIKDCVRSDGAPAQTEFVVEKRFVRAAPASTVPQPAEVPSSVRELPFSLLRIHPVTGRKHQIRIHLAHIGHPIVGDKLYGGDPDLYLALVERRLTAEQRARLMLPCHALHASRIRFAWRGANYHFCADPEAVFTDFVMARSRKDAFQPRMNTDGHRAAEPQPRGVF